MCYGILSEGGRLYRWEKDTHQPNKPRPWLESVQYTFFPHTFLAAFIITSQYVQQQPIAPTETMLFVVLRS